MDRHFVKALLFAWGRAEFRAGLPTDPRVGHRGRRARLPPHLARHPLPVLAAALRALSGGLGVLAPADGITRHHVWLLTDGHALASTPIMYRRLWFDLHATVLHAEHALARAANNPAQTGPAEPP